MLSIQEMEALIDKLDQSSIDEFSYEANGAKIKLKKHHSVVQTVTNEAVHIPQTPQIKEQVAPSPQGKTGPWTVTFKSSVLLT